MLCKNRAVADVLTVDFPIKLPLCDFLIWLDVPFNAHENLLRNYSDKLNLIFLLFG
jgi:hypothetical protein